MDQDLHSPKFDLNDGWLITIKSSEISEGYPYLTSALTKGLIKPKLFVERRYIIPLSAKVKIDKQFRADCTLLKEDIYTKVNATDLKHIDEQYKAVLINQLYEGVKEAVATTIRLDKDQYNWFVQKIVLKKQAYEIPFYTGSCVSSSSKYFLYKIDGKLKFTRENYIWYGDYIIFDTELFVDVIDLAKSDLMLIDEKSRDKLKSDIDDLFQ